MKENKNKNLHGAKGIETLDNMVMPCMKEDILHCIRRITV